MAMKHFLREYPMPKEKPCIYTGLFKKPISKRPWSDRPNKCLDGVSYTQFEDAYNVILGPYMSLFDMFHGCCSYFADYFWYKNPDWKEICMTRGNFWNTIIHTYCIKEVDGKTLFADARGITDDPETFFNDFTCSDMMSTHEVTQEERVEKTWFVSEYEKAYEYVYGAGLNSFVF